MKHKHWTVMAFDKYTPEKAYFNPIEVHIEDCPTEKDAVRQASKIVLRKEYVVRSVRECSVCKIQRDAQEAVSKFLKKEINEDEE